MVAGLEFAAANPTAKMGKLQLGECTMQIEKKAKREIFAIE